MTFQFHFIDVSASFDKPLGIDQAAALAASKQAPSASDVRAMAELLDWEPPTAPSELGQRCTKALEAFAATDAGRKALLKLSSGCPAVQALLTRCTPVIDLVAA